MFQGTSSRKFSILILLFNVFLFELIFAQTSEPTLNNESYFQFDQTLGLEHTGLANGINYTKQYKTKKGEHVFLDTPDFINGTLVYDGQPYFNIPIKYNVLDDEVLAHIKGRFTENEFQLIKEKIAQFTIKNRTFINIDTQTSENEKANGFYEVLMENPLFLLLEKHTKKQQEVKENNRYLSEFAYKRQHTIVYKGIYHPLKSEKDLIKLFPDLKKDIKSYALTFKSIRKENKGNYFKKILEQLYPKIGSP